MRNRADIQTTDHRRRAAEGIWITFAPRTRLLLVCTLVVVIGAASALLYSHYGSPSPYSLAASTPGSGNPDDSTGEALSEASEGVGSSDGAIEVVDYKVKSGDTLSSIAEEFHTSVNSISYINGILSPDRIAVGQKLSLITNASGIVVTVSKGNTLSDLADKYGVPVDVIIEVNKIADPDALFVGQTLILPGAKMSGRPIATVSRMSSVKWPAQGRVTSGFGWRIHPITRRNELHQGIDIAASSGTTVVAAAAGKVTFSGWNGGYGNLVTIDHGGGIVTRYAHLSKRSVAKGDSISAGQAIGLVGSTGFSTGPHLHFEVRVDGEAVNPRSHLP